MGHKVRINKRTNLPKYVTTYKDRHGKSRYRFRKKGHSQYLFKSLPGTPEFFQEYHACMEGRSAPIIEPGITRTISGSISDLISSYYKSPEFTNLATSTKQAYRRTFEKFREKYGDLPVNGLRRSHIKKILERYVDRPAAGNNLLKRLRTLMQLALDLEFTDTNPTLGIKLFKYKSEGFHTWTEDEVHTFERAYPIGTQARLALALMIYTGMRKSDVVSVGWPNIAGEMFRYKQQKTQTTVILPLHPELRQALERTPKENLTFLVTAYGRPFTANGFGNKMRKWCDAAGLTSCTSHGLRKTISVRLAEAGCTNQEIMAITGHKSLSEVQRYTQAVNKEILAGMAMDKMTEREKIMANPSGRLANFQKNPLKNKE